MNTEIEINGKRVRVEVSRAANKAMKKITVPLLAEMELYFSCLVRKKVRFYERNDISNAERIRVSEQLEVSFRPVMTEVCSVSDTQGDAPPVTDFPIANPKAFIPHWLRIDFKKGEWVGEFGYH